MKDRIKVVLADDHEIVRRGLRLLLEEQEDIEVVGEAADGEEALSKAKTLSPDVILMDIRMPAMDGIEATRRLKSQQPWCKVVALTMYEGYAAECIKAGADGCVLKDTNSAGLTDAIRQAYERQVPLENPPDSVDQLDLVIPAAGVAQVKVPLENPPDSVDQLDLVIPGAGVAQVMRFLAQLEKTIHAAVKQIAGYNKVGTTITVVLPPAPLATYLSKLREIPGVATVGQKQEEPKPKFPFFGRHHTPSSISGSGKEIIVSLS